MAGPPAARISDADRERAVVALREHCVEGRLALEEFSERVEEAFAARTALDLEAIMRELPTPAVPERRSPKRLTLSAFGRFERKGRWRVPRRTFAIVAFGDIDLDLRQAVIEREVVTVELLALFGNVDVYVPEGVEVDVGGLVLFGHRREWGRDEPPLPRTPLVRIRALSLFGTIDVWRVPRGTVGSYREIIRQVRARQRELAA
jgi:hypothetical protein